jgi:hypothetical protein
MLVCSVVFCAERTRAAGVVGTGTSESCTDAALDAALSGGGLVTFNCGGPTTIDISTGTGTKTIAADTTIDGGGLITISGGDSVQVFAVNSGVDFTVRNVTIENGLGTDSGAGGISSVGGSLRVANSTFAGNRGQFGGGISNVGGTLTVTSSTFRGNLTAGVAGGAGVYTERGESLITNCTFTDNDARASDGAGGGVLNCSGTVTIVNSTFAQNPGGAISSVCQEPSTFLRNTIITASPGGFPNCGSKGIIDGGHNLEDGTSCGFTAENDSLSDTDAELDPAGLKNNGGSTETIALCAAVGAPAGCAAASPAIDAGDPEVCANPPVNGVDQRGYARPGEGSVNCSIGAFEYNSSGPPLATATATATATPSVSPTPTSSPVPSTTPSASPTPSPSVTATATRTVTSTPTASATSSPSGTATTPPSGGGDGGCTVTPGHSNGAAWWLLVPAVVLVRAHRRKKVSARRFLCREAR